MFVVHGGNQKQSCEQIPVNPFCGRQDRTRHRPRGRACVSTQCKQRLEYVGGVEFDSVDSKHYPPDYANDFQTLTKKS